MFAFAILATEPLPPNGSSTKSPGLDQDLIWSSANWNGNTAGCLTLSVPIKYFVESLGAYILVLHFLLWALALKWNLLETFQCVDGG